LVTKGQVLARLEDEDLQSSLEQLRAQETFTRQEYLRDEHLLSFGGVARNAYEKAKSDWEAAKAAVARATTEAGYTKIVAPANGRIIRRDGEIGQLIAANQPVFWLAQKSALRVSAEVDEEDVGTVKAGQDALIRADAFPGQIFHGRVRTITPKGDPVARSYRVRIELPDDTPLLIGMTAETNIITARREDALLVPATALAGDKVWVVADGKLVQRPVILGAKGAERVEVTNGIGADDLIVAKPAAQLVAGKAVKTELPAKAQP
jgi:RND family efflux transporter MFP subunit